MKAILAKVAPWVRLLPYVAIAALSAALVLQGADLKGTRAALKAEREVSAFLRQNINTLSTTVKQKDDAIRLQNKGVEALAAAAQANREAYAASMRAARASAATDKAAAELILKLNPPASDELTQCRAARDLLAKELTQ